MVNQEHWLDGWGPAPDHRRTFCYLSYDEKQNLITISQLSLGAWHIFCRSGGIKSIETWEDDHIACVGTEINEIGIGFWYVGYEVVGAFSYPDSRKAQDVIREALELEIAMWQDELVDELSGEEADWL